MLKTVNKTLYCLVYNMRELALKREEEIEQHRNKAVNFCAN